MKTDLKITYFFQKGRINRIDSSVPYAKEMFYGYHYFQSKYKHTKIVEFRNHEKKWHKILFFFEKKLRNALKLPLYWSFITSLKNFKIIRNSNILVLTNNRVGCAVLPMVIFAKLFNKDLKSNCFIMGLFSRKPKYKFLEFFQKIYLKLFLTFTDNLIFLSEGEKNYAEVEYSSFAYKFHVIPFGVDRSIWRSKFCEKDIDLLFVGNDGFRDYEFTSILINNLSHYRITVVSNEINKSDTKIVNENCNILNGSWGSPEITDVQLAELYSRSKLTILPLKNSLQPSGQSVTLQSISCGTPVLITKTPGFWDNKNFRDNKNIYFLQKNEVEKWKMQIDKILKKYEENTEFMNKNLENLIENYTLEKFNSKLEKLIIK